MIRAIYFILFELFENSVKTGWLTEQIPKHIATAFARVFEKKLKQIVIEIGKSSGRYHIWISVNWMLQADAHFKSTSLSRRFQAF